MVTKRSLQVTHRNIIVLIYRHGPAPDLIASDLGISVAQLQQELARWEVAGDLYAHRLAQVIEAIEACGFNIQLIADHLGVRRDIADGWIRSNPQALRLYESKRSKIQDRAQDELMKAIDRGAPWAIKLALTQTARGRSMGYGDRNETNDIDAEAAALGVDWRMLVQSLADQAARNARTSPGPEEEEPLLLTDHQQSVGDEGLESG